jgi:hypothetical protein
MRTNVTLTILTEMVDSFCHIVGNIGKWSTATTAEKNMKKNFAIDAFSFETGFVFLFYSTNELMRCT